MNKKNTLEELKEIKEQLMKDLTDMKYEENIVEAAVSNPKQINLIRGLKNYNKPIKHCSDLLKALNLKDREINSKINSSKLINYYKILTGVDVSKASITALPVEEDSANECLYLYVIDAKIGNLQFKISYSSNKPPDDLSQSQEILKQITITFASSNLQEEVQEDLDFISNHCTNIYSAVLFLKEFYKFNQIRRNLCTELINRHKNYLNVAINDKQICIICEGVKHPNKTLLRWKIKLEETNYTVRDSFQVVTSLLDTQVISEIEDAFKKICNHSNWSTLSENDKLHLLNSVVNSIVEADNRDVSVGYSVSEAEYTNG